MIVDMEAATEEQIMRYARVLTTLAAEHGLSELRVGSDGRLVADVAPGRTLIDIAKFELEAQAILQADVIVISSRSETGRAMATTALRRQSPAA